MKKHIREAVSFLREIGAGNIEIEQGRHYKLLFDAAGRRQRLIMSVSPNDVATALHNFRIDARKAMRGAL